MEIKSEKILSISPPFARGGAHSTAPLAAKWQSEQFFSDLSFVSLAQKGMVIMMDEFQKKRICELRANGYGYKLIAAELGISRDVVRNFCKKHSLNGHISGMDKDVRKIVLSNAMCANCRKPIKQKRKGKARRFCSDECRRSWWKENSGMGQRKEMALYECLCKFCNTEFESYGNKNRKYCSHECYIKDRFGKKK